MKAPILLVEDNVGDVFLIREYLNMGELRYHELLVADTLAGATKTLADVAPMVVLLDLSLPDSANLATYHAVVAVAPEVPIIILSGLENQDLALKMVKEGAQDYLLKGAFDERILEKAISYAVERYRRTLEMRRSAAMYRLLFDHNPTPMWAFEKHNLRFLMVNDAAVQHYGYSREEFLAMTVADIRPPKDRSRFIQHHEESKVERLTDAGEWRHLRKDGSIIDVVILSDHIEFEGHDAELVVVHDITERKREEQHLRLLESVVQNTQDAIVITEAEPKGEPGPRIMYTNPAFTQQTGYSAAEVLGRNPRLLQGPETDRKELDRVREALEQWRPVDAEVINYDKEGKPFWVQFSIFPVADLNGWYTNWISVQRDITDKKRYELELVGLNQELDLKVQERTQELWAANQQLTLNNAQITDSIRYAQRIQRAILAKPEEITDRFPESFCLDLPRDLVSGDFHWHHAGKDIRWIAVADCTGHGVPGAMMSLIGNDLLNRAIVEQGLTDPAEVLSHMNEGLNRILKYGTLFTDVHDGMDIALCAIDDARKEIRFAGALRPLYVQAPGSKEVLEIPCTKSALGNILSHEEHRSFETRTMALEPGMFIYLCSDGYYSQFGGPRDKKMLKHRFLTFLREMDPDANMALRGDTLLSKFHAWKGDHEQVDDVIVVGIRV